MNKELDQKLVEAFPLLYADRHKSMQETCMCWGFSCGDGWFDIICELSEKLEPIIQKYLDKVNPSKCYRCGCKRHKHRWMPSGKRVCTTVHRVPYMPCKHIGGCAIPQWKVDIKYYGFKAGVKKSLRYDWNYTKYRMRIRINRLFAKLAKLGLKHDLECKCLEFEISHPRASQVKEKYGTLRFYMSSGNEEIWNLIEEAEKKSAETCEGCGVPGELRQGSWSGTSCDNCGENYE